MRDPHSLGDFTFEYGSIYSPYGDGIEEIDLRKVAVPPKYDVYRFIESLLDEKF